MNITPENHLENAFKELKAFSISGIGTFRKIKGSNDEVEIEIDPVVDENILLETWLIEEKALDVSAATAIERHLRMKIQWDLKTKSQYEISGIGVLHQHFTGKRSFYAYTKANEQPPISKSASEPEPEPQIPPVSEPQSNKKQTPWMAYTLVGAFLLIGCFIIYKGVQTTKSSNEIVVNEIDGVSDTAIVAKSVLPVSEIPETKTEPEAKEVIQKAIVTETPEIKAVVEETSITQRVAEPIPDTKETTQIVGDLSLLDTVKTTKIPSPTSTSTPTARIAQPVSQTAYQWHLILGSYVTEASAQKAFASLTAQGHTPTLIKPQQGVEQPYRVSIYNSPERGKVESFQSTYQRSTGSATWLLQVRE